MKLLEYIEKQGLSEERLRKALKGSDDGRCEIDDWGDALVERLRAIADRVVPGGSERIQAPEFNEEEFYKLLTEIELGPGVRAAVTILIGLAKAAWKSADRFMKLLEEKDLAH